MEIKKVWDSVVYFQRDGKPLYLFSFSGSASGFGSHTFSDDQLREVGKLYHLLAGDESLQTVYRLFQYSLETEADPLRSFLAAWTAAEILVKKISRNYQEGFFEKIKSGKHAEFSKMHFEVIRDERITLVIMFAAMASHLSSDTFDNDIAEFKKSKAIRDDIHNGNLIAKSHLPAKAIRDLASRYLLLHLQG